MQPHAASVALERERARAEQAVETARLFVEDWLDQTLRVAAPSGGLRLHAAMRDAVFPGGKRARPVLVRLVADACVGNGGELVGRMATAVELVHCASLVHDDLPSFDDAPLRRGKPSCHVRFGEATAILVGDALLTLAFETLAGAPAADAPIAVQLVRLLAEATGARSGIIGGQGLELQPHIDVTTYHLQKTSALFRAAAAGGAMAAGAVSSLSRWARFGDLVGRALQLRDDLGDVTGSVEELGKPVGQDAAGARPNAVLELGVDGARAALDAVVDEATELLGPATTATAPLRLVLAQVSGNAGASR